MEPSYTKVQFWIMVSVVFSALFLEGIIDNVKSITLPDLRDYFDASYTLYGILSSAPSLSYVVCCIIGYLLSGVISFKWTFVLGASISALGCIYTVFSPDFINATISMFLSSSFLGIADVCCNAIAAIIFTENTATMVCLMNFCYGFGAIVAPYLATLIMDHTDERFRAVYFIIGIIILVFTAVYACVPFAVRKAPQVEDKGDGVHISILKAYIHPMVWFFSLTLTVLTQVERSAMLWGGVYIEDVVHLDPKKEGALFNTLFYVFFTIARFVGGFIEDRFGLIPTLVTIIITCIVLLIAGFCLGQVGIWILCATGLCAGLFWPTLMCIAYDYFGVSSPNATSAILPITFTMLTLLQLGLGNINDIIGPEWAYRSCILFLLIALACVYVIHRKLKTRKEQQPLLDSQTEPLTSV